MAQDLNPSHRKYVARPYLDWMAANRLMSAAERAHQATGTMLAIQHNTGLITDAERDNALVWSYAVTIERARIMINHGPVK